MAKTGKVNKVNKLEEREAKRRSAVAGFIDEPTRKPVPAGRPDSRELKKRYCLALKPSLYRDIQQLAYVQCKSTSQMIDELMEKYIRENAQLLEDKWPGRLIGLLGAIYGDSRIFCF